MNIWSIKSQSIEQKQTLAAGYYKTTDCEKNDIFITADYA